MTEWGRRRETLPLLVPIDAAVILLSGGECETASLPLLVLIDAVVGGE